MSEQQLKQQLGKDGRNLTWLTVVVIVAALRFAREFLIPVVLAVLLAFVLAPLASLLRRIGLKRGLANASVVLLTFLVIGGLGSLIATQLVDLARQLPEYQQNIDHKMQSLRASGGGILKRVTNAIHRFGEELTPTTPPPSPAERSHSVQPVPVEVHQMPFSPLSLMRTVLGSAVDFLILFVVIIVFVVFMLSQREDLRQRLLRLGKARPNMTSRMLDETAERVSRYLLAQLAVNTAYGVLAGLATLCLGIPDPLLWGVLAAILRYIPYLGIWVAGIMPAGLALAVDPGFARALAVMGIYFGIDVIAYNFIEPFLYGKTTGLTPLAVLAAALFWTWLWGPVGLLLSTPLTVCLVVMGRNIPDLNFVSILLSDEPHRAVSRPQPQDYQEESTRKAA